MPQGRSRQSFTKSKCSRQHYFVSDSSSHPNARTDHKVVRIVEKHETTILIETFDLERSESHGAAAEATSGSKPKHFWEQCREAAINATFKAIAELGIKWIWPFVLATLIASWTWVRQVVGS